MKYIISIIVFLLLVSQSIAYKPERAKNNFAHELAECAAYFMLISKMPKLDQQTSKKLWDSGMSLSVLSAQLTSEKLSLSRVDLSMKIMTREMGKWEGVSIINNKYGFPCQDLVKGPEARLGYWLNKKD